MAQEPRRSTRRRPSKRASGDSSTAVKLSQEECDRIVTIWAKAVDTQMHFNEMSVRSRQLGLTFVAAALGVGIVLLSREEAYDIPVSFWIVSFDVHITVILTLAAWLALKAVRLLDLNVYHRMLRGAVTFGEDFEEHYMKKVFDLEKGMTQAISHYSRRQDADKVIKSDGKVKYTGKSEITAETKIKQFYDYTTYFLWIAAFVLFLITNLSSWWPPANGPASGDTRPIQGENFTEATGASKTG